MRAAERGSSLLSTVQMQSVTHRSAVVQAFRSVARLYSSRRDAKRHISHLSWFRETQKSRQVKPESIVDHFLRSACQPYLVNEAA